ncbi:MAG TPA: glycosyltransferase 87 family protein [Thermoanaerobaculia bacterium]|nr:glycosyltransferase 87 family protein [Thermoanaerobaculia bacterium]
MTALPSWATRTVPERAVLAGGIVLGVILRAVQIATSIGTVDASNWLRHVLYVDQLGVLRAYPASRLINHPTLGLEVAYWSWKVGGALGLHFFDTFRILMSAADVVTALALVALARHVGMKPVWVALVFFLSPASIFISAFHCNSDPLMVMFIVLALLATVRQRPIAAGLLIAAAVGIKIIAFAALPLLLFGFRGWKARVQFLLASAVLGAIVFVPPVIASGWIAIRNVFGYTGWRGAWGFHLALNIIGFVFPQIVPKDSSTFLTPLLILAMLALWVVEARRAFHGGLEPQRLIRVTGLAFLLVLFLGPGFGVQYLMWLLPYPAFFLRRTQTLILHGLISAFLFAVYTSWSHGWPWLWASGSTNPVWVGVLGLVVWAAIGWAAASNARAIYARAS